MGNCICCGLFCLLVGNVPLAVVPWNGGISFGGVVVFLFADLIVPPILDIYRKYSGWKVSAFLFMTFYLAMAGAALVVGFAFSALYLIPQQRSARVMQEAISWNYTTWLNIGFLMLAALLIFRFLRTGGPDMLRMMSGGQHKEDHKHDGAET